MRREWPFVGRVEQRREALAAVASGTGFVLTGVAGVGRSGLLGRITERLDAERFSLIQAFATEVTSTMELAAYAHALPPEVFRQDDPGSALVMAFSLITERAGNRSVVLVIDDVHRLDPVSAALTHLAVRSGRARLAATMVTGARPPEPISMLWRENLVRSITVEPLDQATVAAIGGRFVGGQLDESTARRLWELSEGNALVLREIMETLGDRGAFVPRHGVWHWREDTAGLMNDRAETIARRLAETPERARRVIECVALAEPLESAVAARLVDQDAVEQALAGGLIRSEHDQGRIRLHAGRPLYADVVRHRMAPHHRLGHIRALAATMSGATDRLTVSRLGRWHLDFAVPVGAEVLVKAGGLAHGSCDLELTRRLAEAAAALGAGFSATALSASALGFSGEPEAALALLDDAWARLTNDEDRIRWAMIRALIIFDGRHDVRAVEELRSIITRLTSPRRDILASLAACLLIGRGEHAEGERELARLVDDPDTSPVARWHSVAMINALLAARGGPGLCVGFLAVDDGARAHYADWPTLRATAGAARWRTAMVSGEIRTLIPESGVAGIREFSVVDVQTLLAHAIAARLRGQLTEAARAAAAAVATATRGGRAFLSVAWAEVAHIAALAGDTAAAVGAMDECDRLSRRSMAFNYPIVELARVAVALASVGPTAAAQTARAAARRLRADGFHGFERHARHALVRIGVSTSDDAVRLSELAAMTRDADGHGETLAEAIARHAEAVARAAGDLTGAELTVVSETLGSVARVFFELDLRVLAVETAARRYTLLREHRADGVGAAAAILTGMLAACDETLRVEVTVPSLTVREAEVAELAERGLTPAEISARLFIERRSVESHIYRLYRKLGLSGRADLPGTLGLSRLLRDREDTQRINQTGPE